MLLDGRLHRAERWSLGRLHVGLEFGPTGETVFEGKLILGISNGRGRSGGKQFGYLLLQVAEIRILRQRAVGAGGGLGRHGDLLSWIARLSACAGPKEGSLDVMTATMGLDPCRGPVALADAGHKDIDSSRRGSSVPMMAGVSVLQALDRLRFHGYRETPSPATGLRSFVEQTRRLHL